MRPTGNGGAPSTLPCIGLGIGDAATPVPPSRRPAVPPLLTTVGNVTLWLAFLLGVWGFGTGIVAVRSRNDALALSAVRTPGALLGVLIVSFASLVAGVVRQDFNLAFVALHMTRALPLPYALGSVGQSFPALLLLVASGVALGGFLQRSPRSASAASAAVAVLAVIAMVVGPFGRLGYTPLEGQGLDPAPRHPLALVELALIDLGLVALAAAALRSRASLVAAWVLLSAGVGIRFWRGYAVMTQDSTGYLAAAAVVGWLVAGAALYGLPRRSLDQVVALGGLALVVIAAVASALSPTRVVRLSTGREIEMRTPVGPAVFTSLGVSRFEIPGGVTAAATFSIKRGVADRELKTAEQRRYFDLYGHRVGGVDRPAVFHGALFDFRVTYEPAALAPVVQEAVDMAVYEVRVVPVAWCAWLGFVLMVFGGLLTAGLQRGRGQ